MTPEELIAAQIEREPIAAERAQQKVKNTPTVQAMKEASDLMHQASRTPRRGKRIRLILEAASAYVAPMRAVAACRRGCSHCCTAPTIPISRAEAEHLAKGTGRQLQEPVHKISKRESCRFPSLDMPCSFLVGNECSAYEHRPIICRSHMNLDDDPLLCQVLPDRSANVPYLDARGFMNVTTDLLIDETFADIREWFPPEIAS